MANLSDLIAAHQAAMAEYDACDDAHWDDRKDVIDANINASRCALLEHRPATLTEVRIKAEFMAAEKAFTEWEDVEQVAIIRALTPPAADVTAVEALIAAHKAAFAALEVACDANDDETQAKASDATADTMYAIIEHPYSSLDELKRGVAYIVEHHRTTGDGDLGAWLEDLANALRPAPAAISPIMTLFRRWNELRDQSDEAGIGNEEVDRRCAETDAVMVEISSLPPTTALDFAAKLSCITHYGNYDDLGGDVQGTGSALIREAATMVGHPEHIHARHKDAGGASCD